MLPVSTLKTVTAVCFLIGASCAFAQDWFASPNEPHGQVTGAISQTSKGLYRVEITEVNGTLTGEGRRDGVWLRPGTHTIGARRANIRSEHAQVVGSTGQIPRDASKIEIEVEEGHTYQIALDASSPRRADWELVVWNVKD